MTMGGVRDDLAGYVYAFLGPGTNLIWRPLLAAMVRIGILHRREAALEVSVLELYCLHGLPPIGRWS